MKAFEAWESMEREMGERNEGKSHPPFPPAS